ANQFDALLLHESSHDAQERSVWLDWQKAAFLQRRLAPRLARGEVFHAIVGRQVRIGGRCPDAIIDAVDDAGPSMPALAQDALKTVAVIRRLNLPRIRRTDCVQQVREDEAGFEEVQLAMKFELSLVEQLPIEPGDVHVPVPEH